MTYKAINNSRWVCIDDTEVEMYYNAGYKIYKTVEVELSDDEVQEIIDGITSTEV